MWEISLYIQYGATLDFTKGGASHANYSYFPFAMLGVTEEAAEPKPIFEMVNKRVRR